MSTATSAAAGRGDRGAGCGRRGAGHGWLRVKRLPGPGGQVAVVHAGQRQRPGHGAGLGGEHAEQQVTGLDLALARAAAFSARSSTSLPDAAMRARRFGSRLAARQPAGEAA